MFNDYVKALRLSVTNLARTTALVATSVLVAQPPANRAASDKAVDELMGKIANNYDKLRQDMQQVTSAKQMNTGKDTAQPEPAPTPTMKRR